MLKRLAALAAVLWLAAPAAVGADVPVIELQADIQPVSAAFVVRAIERAEAERAPLVIIQLDTPGGLVSSMRRITDKIIASRSPVAVFVGPSGARAASAGFVIALSADVFAMAPGTHTGAAHPVLSMKSPDPVMNKKMESDMAADVRTKAVARGRNAEMAEKAVLESRSFTEREAKEAHLADEIVKNADELIRRLDGRTIRRFDGHEVRLDLAHQKSTRVVMSSRERFLCVIAGPDLMFLLLLGALAGLGTELTHPGVLFPGIVGTLCLILFLFASSVLPVNGAGVALIVLSVALFAAEIKVPAYGLLTVSGIVAMILGAMMLVDAPSPELRVSLRTIVPAAVLMALWASLVVRLVLRAQQAPKVTGSEGMVGAAAVAETDLTPSGWVRVRGESWRAIADGNVAKGAELRVTAVNGLTVRVTAAGKEM